MIGPFYFIFLFIRPRHFPPLLETRLVEERPPWAVSLTSAWTGFSASPRTNAHGWVLRFRSCTLYLALDVQILFQVDFLLFTDTHATRRGLIPIVITS